MLTVLFPPLQPFQPGRSLSCRLGTAMLGCPAHPAALTGPGPTSPNYNTTAFGRRPRRPPQILYFDLQSSIPSAPTTSSCRAGHHAITQPPAIPRQSRRGARGHTSSPWPLVLPPLATCLGSYGHLSWLWPLVLAMATCIPIIPWPLFLMALTTRLAAFGHWSCHLWPLILPGLATFGHLS